MLGGYSVWSSPKGNLDLLGGVRYLGLDLTTNWNLMVSISGPGGGGASFPASGTVSGNQDIWNGVVGLRGRVRLGEGNWSLPYCLLAWSG